MNKAHHHLSARYHFYRKWHEHPYHQHHHWLVAFLALLIGSYAIAGAWQVALVEQELWVSSLAEVRAQSPSTMRVGGSTPGQGSLNLNCDIEGKVDAFDFALFIYYWGKTPPFTTACGMNADINNDGEVNIADLSVLAGCWGSPPTNPECGGTVPLGESVPARTGLQPEDVAAEVNVDPGTDLTAPTTLEGTLLAIHADDFDRNQSREFFLLQTDGGQFFDVSSLSGLSLELHGSRMRVKNIKTESNTSRESLSPGGVITGGEIVVVKKAQAPRAASTGTQRVAILLMNSEDDKRQPWTKDFVNNLYFNSARSVSNYFKEVSYGNTFLSGEVFGWYTMPWGYNICNFFSEVIEAADADVDFSGFDRVVFAFPNRDCPYGGAATVDVYPLQTNDGQVSLGLNWINGAMDEYVTSHEQGHNYGVAHANSWHCTPGDIYQGSECQSTEYGNPYDVMGVGWPQRHMNAVFKHHLGWLDDGRAPFITQSGTYRLTPLEVETQKWQTLRLRRNADETYYLEYRRPLGFDQDIDPRPGLLINFKRDSERYPGSYLTYANSSPEQFLLEPGNTFSDPDSGITIGPILTADDNEIVFAVSRGEPQCILHPPSIAKYYSTKIYLYTDDLNLNQSFTIDFVLANGDNPVCRDSSVFQISIGEQAPSDWQYAISPAGEFSLSPGQGAMVSIQVGLTPTVQLGSYYIPVMATNKSRNETVTAGTTEVNVIKRVRASLDPTSPGPSIVAVGAKDVVFTKVLLTGGSWPTTLYGGFIESDSEGAFKNFSNIRIYDGNRITRDTLLGKVDRLEDFSQGLIHSAGAQFTSVKISIPPQTSKVLTLVSDVDPVASGSGRLGILWLNIDFGATGLPVYGSTMTFGEPQSAPSTPSISGPTSGTTSQTLSYTFTSQDPENSDIEYLIEWEPGVQSQWSQPWESGIPFSASHQWATSGTKCLKAQAKDALSQATSAWSGCYNVTISVPPLSDTTAPTITFFSPSRSSVCSGSSVTLFWMASDTGGSLFNRVEVWQNQGSLWTPVSSGDCSGSKPFNGSCAITPPATTQYGVHAIDNAGNCIAESGDHCGGVSSDSLDPRASQGPDTITVTTAPGAPDIITFSNTTSSGTRVSWSAGSGATSYYLYRCSGSGCSRPGTPTASNVLSPYQDTGLSCGTPYTYWIESRNSCGRGVFSDPGTITTSSCPPANQPPSTPSISGPTSGTTAQTLTYTFTSTDPENGDIEYLIEWESNAQSQWTQPFESGTSHSDSHRWTTTGTKCLKAQARDVSPQATSTISAWSGCYNVTISDPPSDTTPPTVVSLSASGTPRPTITWSVSDAGGSGLSFVQVWRAPRVCAQAQGTDFINASGNITGQSSWQEPSNLSSGTYCYGLHVNDVAGNYATETPAQRLQVVIAASPSDATPPTISSFDVQPRSGPGPFTLSWAVSDTKSGIASIEPWHSPTACSSATSQTRVPLITLSGAATSYSHAGVAGPNCYGIHVKNQAGNMITEAQAGKGSIEVSKQNSSIIQGLPQYVHGEFIVKFKTDPQLRKQSGVLGFLAKRLFGQPDVVTGIDSVNELNKKYGIQDFVEVFPQAQNPDLRRIYKFKISLEADLVSVVKQYQADPNVVYAEPNHLYYSMFTPNDPLYPEQWAHQNTQAEQGWDSERGNQDTVIAIVDTGVDYAHEDLADNMLGDCANGCPAGTGFDYVDINTVAYVQQGFELIIGEDYMIPDSKPSDYNGHGTHVAGIAAAVANNEKGVAGVCHFCKLMPLRAGFSIRYQNRVVGSLESDDIAAALRYAADNTADVVSMSFGGPESQTIQEAIDYAHGSGVVLIAAAGNDNTDLKSYPAGFDNVLAVSATDSGDRRAGFSNYGYWVDVAAPGTSIISTVPKQGSISHPSGYASLSGTSMATPYVAGISGLLLSRNSGWEWKEVYQVLKRGVDEVTTDKYIGSGRVNMRKALRVEPLNIEARIDSPASGEVIQGTVEIRGTALGDSYRVEYGNGDNPEKWNVIQSSQSSVEDGVLAHWDTAALPDGSYTIRLVVTKEGFILEDRILLQKGYIITLHLVDERAIALYALESRSGEGYSDVGLLSPNKPKVIVLPQGVYDIVSVINFPYISDWYLIVKTKVNPVFDKDVYISSLDAKNEVTTYVLDKNGNQISERGEMISITGSSFFAFVPLSTTNEALSAVTMKKVGGEEIGIMAQKGSLSVQEVKGFKEKNFSLFTAKLNSNSRIFVSDIEDFSKGMYWFAYGRAGDELYELKHSFSDLAGDTEIRINPESYEHVTYRYHVDPGYNSVHYNTFVYGGIRSFGVLFYVFRKGGEPVLLSPFIHEIYSVKDPSENFSPFKTHIEVLENLEPHDNGYSYKNVLLRTAPLDEIDKGVVTFEHVPGALFVEANDAPLIYTSSLKDFSFGVPPVLWRGEFMNGGDYVNVRTFLSYGADHDLYVIKGMNFRIYVNGDLKCTGTLPSYFSEIFDQDWSHRSAFSRCYGQKAMSPLPGEVEMDLSYIYSDKGRNFNSEVQAIFDTSKSDKNPPTIKTFNMIADEGRGVVDMSFGMDPEGGSMDSFDVAVETEGRWVPLSFEQKGYLYVFSIPGRYVTGGGVKLKLQVADSSKNSLRYVFEIPIDVTFLSNQPPATPTISGPTSGTTSQTLTYTFTSTDPENGDIEYLIEWEPGVQSQWTQPFESGTSHSDSHRWTTTGTKCLKAQAKDALSQATSAWSGCYHVAISAPPTQPDLQGTATAPSNPTLNTPLAFTGTVRNLGTASVGASQARFCVYQGSFILEPVVDCLADGQGRIGSLDTSVSAIPGSSSSASISATAAWTPTSAGTYALYVCADSAFTISESNESNNCGTPAVFVVDVAANLPPSTPSSLSQEFNGTSRPEGSVVNDSTPAFKFTISDPNSGDTVGYQIQISQDVSFAPSEIGYTWSGSTTNPNSVTFQVPNSCPSPMGGYSDCNAPLPDGEYFWRVRARDGAGLTSQWVVFGSSSVADFSLDATAPPAPTCTPAAGTYTGTQNVSLSSSGSSQIRYNIGSTAPSSCSTGTLYSGSIPVSSTQTISSIACDTAGNMSGPRSCAYTINAANQPPSTPTISGPTTGNTTQTLTYTFTSQDPENGDIEYLIEWEPNVQSQWSQPYESGFPYGDSHRWTTTGTKCLKAQAKDALSQATSAWSGCYHVTISAPPDTAPPTVSFSPSQRPWSNTNVSVVVTVTDNVGGSGVNAASLGFCWTTSTSCSPSVGFSNGTSIGQTGNGSWRLCIAASDNSGNPTNPHPTCGGLYQIDKIVPTVNSLSLSGTPRPTVSWTVGDTGGSGVAFVQVWRASIACAQAQGTDFINVSGNITGQSSWQEPSNLSAGTYCYGLHVNDNAGNYATETPAQRREVVVAAPPVPDIAITDILWSPVSPQAGNSVSFQVTLTNQSAASFEVDTVECRLNSPTGTLIGQSSQVIFTANQTRTITCGSRAFPTAGSSSIYAIASVVSGETNTANNTRNETMNVNAVLLPDLIVEDIYPESGNTTLCVGEPERMRVRVKNQGNASAGASTTRLTEHASVVCNLTTPSLNAGLTSLPSCEWTPAATGARTLEAIADQGGTVTESNEGNNSFSKTFSISDCTPSDTTAPTVSFSPPSRPWSNANVSVTVTASDSGSGVAAGSTGFCWTTGSTCTPTVGFTNGTSMGQTSEGNWKLCIAARDNAGNNVSLNPTCSGQYQIDKAPPSVNALSTSGAPRPTVSWTVADTGGSGVAFVQVWRAPRVCAQAQGTDFINASGNITGQSSWQEPGNLSSGTYCYGLHVNDVAGNYATETLAQRLQVVVAPANQPPSPPTISGSTSGNTTQTLTYAFTSTDPENGDIEYLIEWESNAQSQWTQPFESGTSHSDSHRWTTTGTKCLKAQARDVSPQATSTISAWSGCYNVTISASLPPSPCGNGICGPGETLAACAQDCVIVGGSRPDLTGSVPTPWPTSIALGKAATLNYQTFNSSSMPATNTFTEGLYVKLSSATTWPLTPVSGQTKSVNGLGPYTSANGSFSWTPTSCGAYEVLVFVDMNNQVQEGNETNNFAPNAAGRSVTVPCL